MPAICSNLNSPHLVIIAHGVTGDMFSTSVLGFAKRINQLGMNFLAYNNAGPQGVIHRGKNYYDGFTEDLRAAISFARKLKKYDRISLLGISLGGSVVLKYLGEEGLDAQTQIHSAAAISSPLHLPTCAILSQNLENRIYFHHLKSEHLKKLHPYQTELAGLIDLEAIQHAKSWTDLERYLHARLFGFKDLDDFWNEANALDYLPSIAIPTLFMVAKDDMVLSEKCYPTNIAQASKYFHLEAPHNGGHLGFIEKINLETLWGEKRICNFLKHLK